MTLGELIRRLTVTNETTAMARILSELLETGQVIADPDDPDWAIVLSALAVRNLLP